MRKAEFHKHSGNLVSMVLGNHLFDKDDEFLSKLLESVKLFYRENMTILCRFFTNDNDKFANALIQLFGNEITTLFTRKKLFRKTKYYKMQVYLSELSMENVIALAIRYCASPEIEVCDKQGTILFEIGLNDNEGTFINFNTDKFNLNEIKEQMNQILN